MMTKFLWIWGKCVKDTQTSLPQKKIWTKNFKKGRLKWEKTYVKNGLPPWKLKTLVKRRFANKFIMF
jgi:hypothetical protein